MGTRSLTIMYDRSKERSKEIAVLYRQMDGYPSGHGSELAEFLAGFKIVNGYNSSEDGKVANGADCLAAQIVAHFKKGVGQFYLYAAGQRNCGEEYRYIVTTKTGEEPCIEVQDVLSAERDLTKTLFSGPASAFAAWLAIREE